MDGFLYWEITDVNGNSVLDQLEVTKNNAGDKYFEFLMPEYDIIINAVHDFDFNPPTDDNTGDDNNGGGILDGIADIDGIDGALNWLRSLIEKIKAFFEKIIAFFQGIGDYTYTKNYKPKQKFFIKNKKALSLSKLFLLSSLRGDKDLGAKQPLIRATNLSKKKIIQLSDSLFNFS